MLTELLSTIGARIELVAAMVLLPFIVSLAGFAVVAGILYVRSDRTEPFSFRGMLRFIFPPEAYSSNSARIDYLNFAINHLVPFGLTMSVFTFSGTQVEALLSGVFGSPAFTLPAGWIAVGAQLVVIAIATDFGGFFQHWLMHKVPILWHIHRGHHSADVLTPFTTLRAHPIETLQQALVLPLFPGVATGVVLYFSGSQLTSLTVSTMAGLILFRTFMENFRHSSIWISYGWRLNHVIYSPALHQIHHSALPQHFDKNMGDLLSVWDWMFGTLYVPKGREVFPMGLTETTRLENNPHRTLLGFYIEPVRSALRSPLQADALPPKELEASR